MTFEMIDTEVEGAIIKVIGIGGAGGNAVNHMIGRGVEGVEFIAMNTDKQALNRSLAGNIIQLGDAGLGAGANPGAGRNAAENARDEIRAALQGANLIVPSAPPPMAWLVTVISPPPTAPVDVPAAVSTLLTYFVPEPTETSQPQPFPLIVVPEDAD